MGIVMSDRYCQRCGERTSKVIYMGLPGRMCFARDCNSLTGLAAYAPAVATEDEFDGPMFKFLAYEGSYWRALWHWLTGPID